uniref:Uncharacterized protein n=1 Tax=Anguilla anguilla TaxID=7936 RepID=A0A0E9T4Y0_ANGAN
MPIKILEQLNRTFLKKVGKKSILFCM